MNGFPSEKTVERIRELYPKGTRIELEHMDDPYTKLKSGDRGYVNHVDDAGQIHMDWDSGSSLALDYFEDSFKVIAEPELRTEQSQTEDEDSDELEM